MTGPLTQTSTAWRLVIDVCHQHPIKQSRGRNCSIHAGWSRKAGIQLAACQWWARHARAEIPGVAPGPGGALVSPPACADARLAGQQRSPGIPLPPPKLSKAFRPPASSRGPAPTDILRMPRRADPTYPACHFHSRHASATLKQPGPVRPGYLKMRLNRP